MIDYRFLRSGLLAYFLLLAPVLFAQWKKWDGEAGNGLWADPRNWLNDTLPGINDSVLFDHTFQHTDYTVKMPEGTGTVVIRQLTVRPGLSHSILVEWPATNTQASGLWVQGTGGIRLYERATFINASGASPGTAIVISDSLYIYNGGRWVHRSTTGHASYLSKLSRAPGTEAGIFEFDVPGTGGYAVSITGRQFGVLRLTNTHSRNNKNYFSNGSQPLLVRSRLEIDSFVQYTLDFNASFTIQSDLICHGGLDLSAGSYATAITLKGDLLGTGRLFESGTALPLLLLSGNTRQRIHWTGKIQQSVGIGINNQADIDLVSTLRLPHELRLIRGRVFTSNERMLVLDSGANILVDSSVSLSFIHGPLMKIGRQGSNSFLFPVGKNDRLRWIALSGYNGDVQVEYFNINPTQLSAQIDSPLKHISRMEYWQVQSFGPCRPRCTLSFDDVNSGGVTDLLTLCVALLTSGNWRNAGNTGVSGSAGGAGTVRSDSVDMPGGLTYLSLGSMDAFQNPLPILRPGIQSIKLQQRGEKIMWSAPCSLSSYQLLADGKKLQETGAVATAFIPGESQTGEFSLAGMGVSRQLEMQGWDAQGRLLQSNLLLLRKRNESFSILYVGGTRMGEPVTVDILSNKSQYITLIISDMSGCIRSREKVFVRTGRNRVSVQGSGLKTGYFHIFGLSSSFQSASRRFFRFN